VLAETGLLPPNCSAAPPIYPELSAELHNAIVGFLALTVAASGHQPGRPHQETGAAEPAGTTWQYPQLGKEDAASVEQVATDPQARGFHGHVRQLDCKSEAEPSGGVWTTGGRRSLAAHFRPVFGPSATSASGSGVEHNREPHDSSGGSVTLCSASPSQPERLVTPKAMVTSQWLREMSASERTDHPVVQLLRRLGSAFPTLHPVGEHGREARGLRVPVANVLHAGRIIPFPNWELPGGPAGSAAPVPWLRSSW